MQFKQFLLNETRSYLGQKVGDILTAAHELRDDSKNMGSRDLTRFSERIVNQIRRILHSHWPKEEKKHLLTLQKVAVAIMKAIEEKDDLHGTIAGAAAELEKLTADLGVPIHRLGSSPKAQSEQPKGTAEPEKPATQQQPQNIMDQPPAQVPPPGGPPPEAASPLGGSSGPLAAF